MYSTTEVILSMDRCISNKSRALDMLRILDYDGLRNIARCNNLSYEIQLILANNSFMHIRSLIARNITTAKEILSLQSNDRSAHIRELVAMNEATPIFDLKILSHDSDMQVSTRAIMSLEKIKIEGKNYE